MKLIVCPECEGHGKVVHPDLSVWTGADIAYDPEGFESMLDGDYDIPCALCKGNKVVTRKEVNEYRRQQRELAEYHAEQSYWSRLSDYRDY